MNLKIISAGAGSGKTYRLTQEMVQLLDPNNPQQVRASGIIATTFTKKAAGELQERVRLKLLEEGFIHEADELTNSMIGTVHGLGVKLLRRFAFEAGVSPEVQIIADEDQQLMFNQALSSVLKPKRIEGMEALSERFGLNKKERYDWRIEVKRVTDIARANAFDTAILETSKQKSIESFLEFMPKKTKKTRKWYNDQLIEHLQTTLQALRSNEDSTKTTQNVINSLKGFYNKLNNQTLLNWHEWIKIFKDTEKVGKKSRPDVEDLKEFVESVEQHPDLHKDITAFVEEIFNISIEALSEYDAYKKRRGLIDYIDMETNVRRMLDNPVVQEVLTDELDLLMVDEFQDTNPLQLEIFFKLSKFAKFSIWVGDPKQSIYGFRGADPELMKAIVTSVGGVKPEDIQDKSWRSRQDIVHATNALFCKALPDLPQEQVALKPVREKYEEPLEMDNALVHWHFQYDGKGRRLPGKPWFENCIARNIADLLERKPIVFCNKEKTYRPIQAGDIGVLCRSNHACVTMAESIHREGLKAAIARNGLLQTAESRLILACLKFILNQADALSIAEILLLASKKDIEAIIDHRLSFLDSRTHKNESWAAEDAFIQQLHSLREEVPELSSAETLNVMIEYLDLRRIIASWGHVEQRFSNIDELRRLALQYEENCNRLHTAASLGGFLLWLNELSSNGVDSQGSGEGKDSVNVMTYHKSKGLEWPVVICHSLEGKLKDNLWGIHIIPEVEKVDLNNILGNRWLRYWINPYADQIRNTPLEKRLGESTAKQKVVAQALQEEARLLYVGITRARDFLIFPTRKGKAANWLNRVWQNGKSTYETLDPYLSGNGETGTYESPWFWKDVNIPMDTVIRPFPKDFTYTDIPLNPIPFIEKQSGMQSHFPRLYDFDHESIKEEFKLQYHFETRYTDPLLLTEDANEYLIAKVIKAFLCADSLKRPLAARISMADDIIRNFEAIDMITPKQTVAISESYYKYLHSTYTIKTIYRKYPIQIYHKNRLHDTIVDLIILTNKGIIIIQNSGFNGGHKKWKSKAVELASWMHLVKLAIHQQFTSYPKDAKLLIHFVLSGGLAGFGTR